MLSRRRFLQAAVAGTAACCARPARADRYQGLQTDRYLGPAETVAVIRDEKVFTEGPAVDEQGRVYFTNVPAAKILLWDPADKQLSVFRSESNNANGLLFDDRGRLLACEGGAGRVTRTDLSTGAVEVLASQYRQRPLAPPNDLYIGPRGHIFFSSRPGADDPAEGNVNAVYRIDVDGALHQVLHWPDIHMPNGLATSPDGERLYLIEAHPDADRHRDIRVFDLAADGSLSNEQVLVDFYPGRSGDGMCVGSDGLLYVAAGLHARRGTSETLDTRPGIHVISPDGKLLAWRETPEDTVTNCALDRRRRLLYVTCGTRLLRIPLAG